MSFLVTAAFVFAQTAGPDIKVLVDNVSETRTTSTCCPSLTVELKFTGTDTSRIAGVLPVVLETALTNGGQDILPEFNEDQYLLMNEYEDFRGTRGKPVRIKLAAARRDAAKVSLKGKLPLFMPLDNYAPVVVSSDFLKRSGTPVDHISLTERGISIVAFSKADYDKYAEAQKNGIKPGQASSVNPIDALPEAFGDALSSLLSFGFGGDADAIVMVSDPKDQLLGIRFIGTDTKELKPSGRSLSHMQRRGKITYSFGGKPLDGVSLACDFVDETQVQPLSFDITIDLP